jgi:hypothetical protein
MTPEDYEQLREISPFFDDLPSVGVLSPRHSRVVSRVRDSELRLFPMAKAISRRQWDLNDPGSREFDLLVAANVFMYSPSPWQWFEHVLARCSYFLLVDLVRRKRAADDEFGPDGDRMRYAIGDEQPRVADFFDLVLLDGQVLGWRTFYGGANEFDESPMHFMALLRGSRRPAQSTIDHAVVAAVGLLGHGESQSPRRPNDLRLGS